MMNSLSLDLKSGGERSAFGSLFGLRRPLKIAGLGDSIMAGDGQPSGQTRVGSWMAKAAIYTDGRLIPRVFGYGGLTAVGHRSQGYKNDYLSINPDIVVYHLGHNDLPGTGGSLTSAQRTTLRNAILATIQEAVAAGALVLVPELVPLANISVAERDLHNAWLRGLPALTPGVIFMPGFAGLYDAASTVYTPDGTHPNQVGSGALARGFADWVGPHLLGVRSLRDLILESGTAGVTLQRDPISLPFQGSMGGGYPAISSESLVGTGVAVNVSGDGNHIVVWKSGASGSYANKWYLVSFRVRANLITPASKRALLVDVQANDQSLSAYVEGQIDTESQWGHVVCLRKGSASSTQHTMRIVALELFPADTDSAGQIEIAEVYIHDLAAMAAANPGVTWNLP